LGNLVTSVADEEFNTHIVEEAVVPYLFSCLESCSGDFQLCQQVCFAAGNLAFINDFEQEVLACKGIPLVLKYLKGFPEQVTMVTDVIFFSQKYGFWRERKERNHI